MTITNRAELDKCRESAEKQLNAYDCRILVCSGTGCIATGSEKIYKKMLGIAEGAPGVTIEFGPHDEKEHVGLFSFINGCRCVWRKRKRDDAPSPEHVRGSS